MQLFDTIAFTMMLLGPIGLIASIIATVHLLTKRKTSSTAWKLAAAAIGAFALGGFYTFLDGVIFTWWNILGPVGGYILVILAIVQYRKDSGFQSSPENRMIKYRLGNGVR